MIEALRKLVRIPSVTGEEAAESSEFGMLPYGRNVFDALMCVLGICRQLGFKTKNCGNRIGWAEIGEGKELIGILVHLDVVPAGGGWDYEPFDVTESDGRLYGRGVLDDKGPAIAAIWAMRAIKDSGVKLSSRIRIIFGCQEETGDWTDMEYYKKHEEIPDYGFTPDADFPAIYGEKGILALKLTYPLKKSGISEAEGGTAVNVVPDKAMIKLESGEVFEAAGVSAHASTPEEGKNAITEVMRLAAEKYGEKCPLAEIYMKKIGLTLHGEKSSCSFHDEESGSLTMNVGTISSADSKLVLGIDIRYPVTVSHVAVEKGIREAFEPEGFDVSIEEIMEPVFMEKDGRMIEQLTDAYRQVTGRNDEPSVIGGGTYARAMENIVAFGPVIPGHPCTEHMKNESISAEDFYAAAEIYRTALLKLAAVQK